ncbi:MAG: hypothetical protein ACKVHU_16450 [Acidimicrobiales bacterium]
MTSTPPEWMLRPDTYDTVRARIAATTLAEAGALLRAQAAQRHWRIGELVADWAGPARRSFDRRLAETEANAQHLGIRCAAAATNLRAEAELHERREAARIEALREWHIDQVVAIEPAQNEAAVGTVVL